MAVEEETQTPWIFSAEQLNLTPSCQDGMNKAEERSLRKSVCRMIEELGKTIRPRVSPMATNTAKVFFHRVFMAQSLKRQDPKMVGVTCLFVACKSEECLRPLRQFIWTLNQIETDPVTHFRTYPFGKSRVPDRPAEIEEDTKAFQELKNNMMHMERIVLHILGFEFNVDHPTLYFHPLLKFFESVKHKKETRCLVTMDDDGKNVRPSELGDIVLQTAGAMANDCNSTTLCVQYKGSTLAACSVALALRTKKFSVHKPVKWTAQLEEEWKNDPDPRFSGAHVKKEDIEDASSQLLDLYDEQASQGKPPGAADSMSLESAAPGVPPNAAPSQNGIHSSAPDRPPSHQSASVAMTGGSAAASHHPPPNQDHPAQCKPNHVAHSASAPAHTSQPPRIPPGPGNQMPQPKLVDKNELAEKKRRLEAGELVKVDGSVGKQYELIKKGDVYSCTCSIWRHIADLESRRTCKHLMLVRGDKFELGRVGEEGILKSEAKLKELMQQERMQGPQHRHVNGMEQRGDKRPAEGGASQQRDPKRQMM